MLILQFSKSWIVCLLMFEVKQDSLGDVILLPSQGVSFTEVQEGFKAVFNIAEPGKLIIIRDNPFEHSEYFLPWAALGCS